jgi:membrane protein
MGFMARVGSVIRDSYRRVFDEKLSGHHVVELVGELGRRWVRHNNSSMAAAIAYRSLFAVVPLVLFLVMMAELIQADGLAAAFLQTAIDVGSTQVPIDSVFDSLDAGGYMVLVRSVDPLEIILVVLIMIYGVSTVFRELAMAMNLIWDEQKKASMRKSLMWRLMGVGAVFLVGGMLFLVFIISALSAIMIQAWGPTIFLVTSIDTAVNYLIMPLMQSVLFALLYFFVPPVKLALKDVLWPTVVSTFLFLAGQEAVRWYLRTADLAVFSGTVGGFVVFMLWTYYMAMIVLTGAEMSRLYAERWGSLKSSTLKRWWKRTKKQR